MLLITHIIIALSSVAYSTYLFFFPTPSRLRVSFGLVAATVGTGTYLVWSTHSPILQSCLTGLLYIGVVSIGIVTAYYKLAHSTLDN